MPFSLPHHLSITRKNPSSTNLDYQPSNIFLSTWALNHRWIRWVTNKLPSDSKHFPLGGKHRLREMKEGKRSESDKEKTKMRERQRRAITTNIFHGLRKHGGYRLSPRADINEVLRQLAHEAGWVILPDGTTFRAKVSSTCPLCGALRKTAAATNPTSNGGSVIGVGGECSTVALGAPLCSIKDGCSLFCSPESLNDRCLQPISVPGYTYQEPQSSDGGISESSGMAMTSCQEQGELVHLEEDMRRSNERRMMGLLRISHERKGPATSPHDFVWSVFSPTSISDQLLWIVLSRSTKKGMVRVSRTFSLC